MEFLLDTAGVDVNIKTSDEWIPIQLAIRQENMKALELLVQQPLVNINICTAHGLALIMAVQTRNVNFVEILLQKDIIFSAKDHLGRTVHDVLSKCSDVMTKKIEELILK